MFFRRMDIMFVINSVCFENLDFFRNLRRNVIDCIKELYNVLYNYVIYY